MLGGLSKKSVISTILSSVSVSKSSNVLVFFGYGELDLGSGSKFLATLASHDVALCSSLFSSSKLKFRKEGGVIDSIQGMFSLSDLRQSGSSKYLGLYLCSVRLGHGPRVRCHTIVNLPWSQDSWKFLGNLFPIFSWLLPWAELFSLLLGVLYQCMVSCFCFYFIGTYENVLDIKSKILVLLENNHPLQKLVFLILLVTK